MPSAEPQTEVVERTPPGVELLDDPAAEPAAVARSLRDIARANWWFGGLGAVRYGFRSLLQGRAPGQVSVLDVGTGFADIPKDLIRYGSRRGFAVRPIGVERHPAAAAVAKSRGLGIVRADGMALPLREESVDIVVISQVAHHLAGGQIRRLATEASRVARIGVVLADLRRSELAAAAFAIGSRVLAFDRIAREDGITSVRRGFTASELRRLLAAAGVDARVTYRPIARVVATWRV
jgi:SAM-dependent methyltransferase